MSQRLQNNIFLLHSILATSCPLGYQAHATTIDSISMLLLDDYSNTVWRKILTGENIDEFDEFLAIRQYFPH